MKNDRLEWQRSLIRKLISARNADFFFIYSLTHISKDVHMLFLSPKVKGRSVHGKEFMWWSRGGGEWAWKLVSDLLFLDFNYFLRRQKKESFFFFCFFLVVIAFVYLEVSLFVCFWEGISLFVCFLFYLFIYLFIYLFFEFWFECGWFQRKKCLAKPK